MKIQCENITLKYDKKPVVENLSFSINEGDYLCIVGENGSGKTTLIQCLLGLIKPSGGALILDGIDKKEIGYLPQQLLVQRDFPASVFEVVLSGCLSGSGLRPFYLSKDKQLARKNMALLGIADLERHSYKELSGGQQQRVLLARALCAAKKLLILDEPVSGLDPLAAAQMYDNIRAINRDKKMTVVMVSHDIKQAVNDASHILHMNKQAEFFGTTQDYLASSVFEQLTGDEHA